jgi:hypothetical protein
MINKDIVKQIKQDLITTEIHINDIAERYHVSRATVNNINKGISHKENTLYPLRQLNNHYFLDNEVAFIRDLAKQGYSAKQIHIIITKGSYSTISNILGYKTRPEEIEYIPDKFLEERREVFNFIITPHHELINQFNGMITLEDAIYIKLLGRFMADLLDTLEIFLPIIESDMVGFTYKIETKDDIARYLEWGGTTFGTIWWIKSIFNNKINRIGEDPIHYDQFPIGRFKEVDFGINLLIIKEMIEFDTKENYRKKES